MTLELAAPIRSKTKRSSFLYSFTMLPRMEREAMHRVYDFCRYTDDIVDEGPAELQLKHERLEQWRSEVEECYAGNASHPVLKGLRLVLDHFDIPKEDILGLLDGVKMDLVRTRYETFEELRKYCYGVASTVGLISIQIFGAKHADSRKYAENLGYALQLTNILRDIKDDAAHGRIYLPLEDLRTFDCDPQHLLQSTFDSRFRALMKFETERAKEYYALARSFLRSDERRALFAAQIMDAVYFRLLRKIERADYDVFSRRISVSTPHKLLLAGKYWAGSHFLQAQ